MKLYLVEAGSETVQDLVNAQPYPLPVWELQEMEFFTTLQLKVSWKNITSGEAEILENHFEARIQKGLYYFPEIRRPALKRTFKVLLKDVSKIGCRTLDVMHVACALQLEANAFVSFDHRQRTLAQTAGLDVLPAEITRQA